MRTKEQVRTSGTTTEQIMASSDFERGLDDAREGISFDWRNGSWDYERGRLFAHIAPQDMPLRIKGRLNPKAVALCNAAFDRNFVI